MEKQRDPFGAGALRLLAAGHSPVPLKGQSAFLPQWTRYCTDPMSPKAIEAYAGCGSNLGTALGFNGVVQMDRDTDCPEVIALLRPIIADIRTGGGVPVAKFGSKGCSSFYRFDGEAKQWRNRSFLGRDGKPAVELHGWGRSTTLPHSIHPKTLKPYRYTTAATLEDTKPDDLPVIEARHLEAIAAALEPLAPRKQTAPPRAIIGKSSVDLSEAERRRYAAYANAILDRELPQLAAMAPASGRNKRAFDIACRIGRFAHHGIIPLQEIETGIFEACKANGLAKEDSGPRGVLMTIRNGIAAAAPDGLPDLGTQPRRGA